MKTNLQMFSSFLGGVFETSAFVTSIQNDLRTLNTFAINIITQEWVLEDICKIDKWKGPVPNGIFRLFSLSRV